jgi:hypothetical protein
MQQITINPKPKSTHRSITFDRMLYAVLEEEALLLRKPLSRLINDVLISNFRDKVQNKAIIEVTKGYYRDEKTT